MDPLDTIIASEDRDMLTGAIRSLPERERLVLRMIDLEGFSLPETAACAAISRASVRHALSRARQLLCARLAASG